jgi:hypothetical protein
MSVRELKDILSQFENTAESRGLELRLSLSEIVLRKLDELGWTQKRLAHEAEMKESFISRVVHSNANWTSDTAGKVLFALGLTARVQEHHPETPALRVVPGDVGRQVISYNREETNVESTTTWSQAAASAPWKPQTGAA